MTTEPFTSYSRLSPDRTGIRTRGSQGNATRGQRVIEITLFTIFAVTIAVAAIALIVTNSSAHKKVPSHFAAGLAEGRVNVLFITMHEGEDDKVGINAITLVSVKPGEKQAAMISMPPEMWVKVGRFGPNRLGRADILGSSSGYPGEGTGLVSDTVASITGQPVHAVVRMDEDTLASTIDALGGVDVNVTKRFYEWRARKRFGVGVRHLNGERANWFISPYVGGPQGKPEARERRQQQLLLAMLTKLRDAQPKVREQFAKMYCKHDGRLAASTNLTPRELDQFLGALRQTPTVQQITLTHVLEPFEVRALHDRGEALRPRGNDYADVQSIVRGALEQGQAAAIAAK